MASLGGAVRGGQSVNDVIRGYAGNGLCQVGREPGIVVRGCTLGQYAASIFILIFVTVATEIILETCATLTRPILAPVGRVSMLK